MRSNCGRSKPPSAAGTNLPGGALIAATMSSVQSAALRLLQSLSDLRYQFVTVTPASHARVVARPDMGCARDLRGVFGWSLPFEQALLPPAILGAMAEADWLEPCGALWKSRVRVSTVADRLFLHSAFPTDAPDSVFLGPDTIRFADFLRAELGSLGGGSPARRYRRRSRGRRDRRRAARAGRGGGAGRRQRQGARPSPGSTQLLPRSRSRPIEATA